MTRGIATGSGARSGPIRFAARVGGGALALAGLLLAAAATRARQFDAALPEMVDGAPAALGHDVGSSASFAPFAFAVVGPPRGDAAALERALDRIAETADVRVTVVLGDVLPTGGRSPAPLADVLARRWPGLVLLAGPNDGRVAMATSDARIVARVQPPSAWAFLENGCLFRGASGTDAADGTEFGDPTLVFDFSTTPGAAPPTETAQSFGPPATSDTHLGYELVFVRSADVVERTTHSVPRGPSVVSLGRDASLRLLWPLTASTGGLIAVLLAAFALTAVGAGLAAGSRGGLSGRGRAQQAAG